MLQFCAFKFDGLSFPPPVFDGSQPFRLIVEEYSSLPLSPDSQSSSLTSDNPVSLNEDTLFNKEDVGSNANHDDEIQSFNSSISDKTSNIATPSNDANGTDVYGSFDGDKDVASQGSDVSEIGLPLSPCTNETLDDVTSIISNSGRLDSSQPKEIINQGKPDGLFPSKSFAFSEIASKSVSVTEVKIDGSITSTSSAYLDCEPSLTKKSETDDNVAFKRSSASYMDFMPSSSNNTDSDETIEASSVLSEHNQVESSKSATKSKSDETIKDSMKTSGTDGDSSTKSTIDSLDLQKAPTVRDIVPESQGNELKESKAVDASKPKIVTNPVKARISKTAGKTRLKNDTKTSELICEPSCSKSGPVILKPIDSSSFKIARASTANRNSCRKSTAPRNFLPFRPRKEKRPDDDDDDSDDDSDDDEDIDIYGSDSDLTPVDYDSSDDEKIKRKKRTCQDPTQKTKKLKTKKSPYPSPAEVCKAILDDVLLQLVPKVHILRLPNFMVPPDDKADYLDQIYSSINNNMFRDGEERLGYVKRYVPKSKNPDDESDDDSIPFTVPSSLGARPLRKRVILGDSDEETEEENEQEVKIKRARMSSGGKKRRRVLVQDSDSSDDDTDNIDGDDYGIMLDTDEEDEDNELGNSKKESKEIFFKMRKRAFARRKRHDLVTLSSDDEDAAELVDEEAVPEPVDVIPSSQKSERKEIRRVMTEAELEKATKDATSQERKRMERITEMQKQYSQILSEIGADKDDSRLILDIDVKSKQVRVDVHKELVKELKKHQREGIKFLYNSTIESVDKLKDEGSGCILAHCMGLGKTLQVITFVYTLLKNEFTGKYIKTVLIAVPVNTLKNWSDEFTKWITKNGFQTFNVFEMLEETDNAKRAVLLDNWNRDGGVLIIGTSILASLLGLRYSNKKNTSSSVLETIERFLADPGPDMLIVDEGHTLKHTSTKMCKAVLRIKTRRKIMLTGTPLQNNLGEYHTMISIIKPRLLGSKKEFANRFRNPIENGQRADSNEHDVKLMKKRALVLHKLLNGCIQRFDFETLKPFLQPKIEFAIYIRPTKLIADMYNFYLDHVRRKALLWDAGYLRICTNHPALYQLQEDRELAKQEASIRYNVKNKKIPFPEDLRPIGNQKPTGSKSGQETVASAGVTDQPSASKVNEDQYQNSIPKSTNAVDNLSQPSTSKTPNSETNSAAITSEANEKENNGENPPTVDNIELDETESPEVSGRTTLPKGWFKEFIKPDDWKNMELSCKFVVLFKILRACVAINDKLLVVSQSLETLDLLERYLKMNKEMFINNEKITIDWQRGRDYFRIDGQTGPLDRQDAIEAFNSKSTARLFLLSTKAGGVGVNLVGANRCIIFDASWNPSDDIQAIFRIYRLGQIKPVFVYRFIAKDSMEEKIFRKQIVKLSTAIRVLDKQQVKRNFKGSELEEFYSTRPADDYEIPLPNPPKDTLLADLLCQENKEILEYTFIESLLEIKPEEDLPEDERQAAWAEYQKERDAEILAAEERKRIMEEEKRKEDEQRQKEAKEEELRNERARIEKAKEDMLKRLSTINQTVIAPSSEGITSARTSTSTVSKDTPTVSSAPVLSGKNPALAAHTQLVHKLLINPNVQWLIADQAKIRETSSCSGKNKNSSKNGDKDNEEVDSQSIPLTDTNKPETINKSPASIAPSMQSQPRIMPGIAKLSALTDYTKFEKHLKAFAYKTASKPRILLPKLSNIKTRSNQNIGSSKSKQKNVPAADEELNATIAAIKNAFPNQRNYSFINQTAPASDGDLNATISSNKNSLPNQRSYSLLNKTASSSSSSSSSTSTSNPSSSISAVSTTANTAQTTSTLSSSNNPNVSTPYRNNDRNQNIHKPIAVSSHNYRFLMNNRNFNCANPAGYVRNPDQIFSRPQQGPRPMNTNDQEHRPNRIFIPVNYQSNYQRPPQAHSGSTMYNNPILSSNYTQPPPTTPTTPYKGYSGYHQPPLPPPPPPSYHQPAPYYHDRTHTSSSDHLTQYSHQRSSYSSSNGNLSTSIPVVEPNLQPFIDTRLTNSNSNQLASCSTSYPSKSVDPSLYTTNHSTIVSTSSTSTSHVVLEETSDDLLVDSCDAILNRLSGLNLAECQFSELIQILLTLESNVNPIDTSNCAESIIEEIEKIQSALTIKKNRLDEKSRTDLLTEEEILQRIYCEKSLTNLQQQLDSTTGEVN